MIAPKKKTNEQGLMLPITIVITLQTQAGAVIWFVSSMHSDIKKNYERLARTEVMMAELQTNFSKEIIAIAKIEQKISAITEQLQIQHSENSNE